MPIKCSEMNHYSRVTLMADFIWKNNSLSVDKRPKTTPGVCRYCGIPLDISYFVVTSDGEYEVKTGSKTESRAKELLEDCSSPGSIYKEKKSLKKMARKLLNPAGEKDDDLPKRAIEHFNTMSFEISACDIMGQEIIYDDALEFNKNCRESMEANQKAKQKENMSQKRYKNPYADQKPPLGWEFGDLPI